KSRYRLTFLSHLNNTNIRVEEIKGNYQEVLTISRYDQDPNIDDVEVIDFSRNRVLQKCPQYMSEQSKHLRLEDERSPPGIIVYVAFKEFFSEGDLDAVSAKLREKAGEIGDST